MTRIWHPTATLHKRERSAVASLANVPNGTCYAMQLVCSVGHCSTDKENNDFQFRYDSFGVVLRKISTFILKRFHI